jgi:hypothetical protein
LVGWLVSRFTGPGVPFSEQGPSDRDREGKEWKGTEGKEWKGMGRTGRTQTPQHVGLRCCGVRSRRALLLGKLPWPGHVGPSFQSRPWKLFGLSLVLGKLLWVYRVASVLRSGPSWTRPGMSRIREGDFVSFRLRTGTPERCSRIRETVYVSKSHSTGDVLGKTSGVWF